MHVCTLCNQEKPTAWANPQEDKWYCLECLEQVMERDIKAKEKAVKKQGVAYEIFD